MSDWMYKIFGIGQPGDDTEKSNKKSKKNTKKTTVNQTIPFRTAMNGGLFENKKGFYSKSYRFEDINYLTADEEEEERILTQYRDFINYFNPRMTVSVTLFNRRINENARINNMIIQDVDPRLQQYCDDYNTYLKKNYKNGRNDIVEDKLVTVSIEANSHEDAEKRFSKLDKNLMINLEKTGTKCRVFDTEEKLKLLHDFYRRGAEEKLEIEEKNVKRQGTSVKDWIGPDCFVFEKDHMIIGDTYYQALFLSNIAENIPDTFLQEMTDFDFPMIATLTFRSIDKKAASKIIRRQLVGMEKNKYEIQKKNSHDGVDPEMIPFELRHSIEEAEQMLDDTTRRNEKLFNTTLSVIVSGDSLEELKHNVSEVKDVVEQHVCELQVLKFLQEEGLNQTLPFAHDELDIKRTLTSSSVAVFAPFTTQECNHADGITYGMNSITKRVIRIDKSKFKNRNGFILGKPGAGKSFFGKSRDTEERLRNPSDTMIIVDPEGEYVDWCEAMGGQVIELSSTSMNRINPCDCNENYGVDVDGKKVSPINFKADFLLSVFQVMINGDAKANYSLDPVLRGFLDRAIRAAYEDYEKNNYNSEYLPNMRTIKEELEKINDKRAKDLAITCEYFVDGSANLFAEKTEINLDNNLIVFNLVGLQKQIKTLGYVIVMDQIWNTLVANRNEGVRTIVDMDEISIFFKNDLVGEMLQEYWRRGRKWGAEFTGLTQNIEDIIKSECAVTMLSNSEFVVLLGQAEGDMEVISDMYRLSDSQVERLLSAPTGAGIIIYKEDGMRRSVLPFESSFPKNTALYSLITSKMDEVQERKVKKKQRFYEKLENNMAKEIVEYE
ncbi:MAG: ATP-binding protein [Lachnospiraceae bacterium]|nr:ATP-binding protein [Lachnospiraceae bacterium]